MAQRKLLVADDSITIQKVVNLTFADEGFEVISVGDGNSAMDKLREESPDLVMADVNMPGLNGYEICEKIKTGEVDSQIPVILLVGSFEPFDEAEAARVGADDHLTKPFQSISQLVTSVTQLIESENGSELETTQDFSVMEPEQVFATAANGGDSELAVLGSDEITDELKGSEPEEFVSEDFSEVESFEDSEPEPEVETEAVKSEGDEGFQIVTAPMSVDEDSEFGVDTEFSAEFSPDEDSDDKVESQDHSETSSFDTSDENGSVEFSLDEANPLEIPFIEGRSGEDVLPLDDESETFGLVDESAFSENVPVNDEFESINDDTDISFDSETKTEELPPIVDGRTDEVVSPELVDVIVRTVIEALSDDVIRQVAQEVVPERVDSIIREVVQEKMKD